MILLHSLGTLPLGVNSYSKFNSFLLYYLGFLYGNSYKGKHWGLAYSFRGVVLYHHSRKHGGMQADGSGEVAESSTSGSADNRKGKTHQARLEHLRPQSPPPR